MFTKKETGSKNPISPYPLHLAAAKGEFELVEKLILEGVDVKVLNSQNQYAIFTALYMNMIEDVNNTLKKQKESIFKLLNETATVSFAHKDLSGNTIFHQMAIHGFNELLADAIKTEPRGPLLANNDSKYPIHTAILNNQLESAELLMKIETVPTLTDSKGRCALHYAAQQDETDMIQLCSPYYPNLDITDSSGSSILHLACAQFNIAMVSWILNNTQVDVNQTDNNHQTALFCLQNHDHDTDTDTFRILKNLLIEHGATSGASSTKSC